MLAQQLQASVLIVEETTSLHLPVRFRDGTDYILSIAFESNTHRHLVCELHP